MLDTKAFPVENGRVMQTHKILKQVAYEKDFRGKLPKSFPVEAYELYDEILDIANSKKDIKVVDKGLIIPEKSIRVTGRGESISDLDRHRLLSHIGTFYLEQKGDKSNKDVSMSIAISCSEKGIGIAFGSNVHACTNMCVFGDKVMYTYGNNSTPYDKMLEVLREYMNRFESIRAEENLVIDNMIKTRLNHDTVVNIVGDLYIQARKNNFRNQAHSQILNVSEVGKLLDGLFDKSDSSLLDESLDVSLWDFYNMGTNVLNPLHANDPVNTLKPNSLFTNYLLDHFEIDASRLN